MKSPVDIECSSCNLQATHGQGVELEPSEEMALAAMQIDKQSARQLLNSSLPVPSDVLMGHQKALAQIRSFCTEFGLTPSSRGRMSLKPEKEGDEFEDDFS